jgi:hypothetical protein
MIEYNIVIDKGLSFNETIEIKTDSGVPEDLTGSSFLMQIRDYKFSLDFRVSATDTNGLLAVTPILGVVDIKLTPTETDKLVVSKGAYDLIQIKPTGERIGIIGGTVEVNTTVSRP